MPCPTPTTELDRHREESEGAQRIASRAASEARAAEAKRGEAEQRVAAAKAALDSLTTAGGARGAARAPRP